MQNHSMAKGTRIAVVGLSALFPGARDTAGYWDLIVTGRDRITEVPPTHWLIEDYYDPDKTLPDKVYAKTGAFLDDVEFDPMAFGIPPKLLTAIDTVQLLALHAAQTLVDQIPGFGSGKLDRRLTSVILGVAAGTELIGEMDAKIQAPVWIRAMREQGLPEEQVQAVVQRIMDSYVPWEENTFPGLLANVVAGRIANRLNLGGSNFTVDAACASSLAAVSMAIQELRLGRCDLALTGGCDALNDIFMYMCFAKSLALSASGDCRPFSRQADGTVLGEGIGLLALRRLDDALRDGDPVFAVIQGVGSSGDGRAKSIYAPVPEGQAQALTRTYQEAGYPITDLELIEAHGTGTAAGDAAEFAALMQAYQAAGPFRKQGCALGSVKSQIGHTKSAAGAAGLIKAVLSLHHKILPPTIKVDEPNPDLDLTQSPLYLNTATRPWIHAPHSTRKAGVSAFGFGGSNFHVTVEEFTGSGNTPRFQPFPLTLLLLHAQSPAHLARRVAELPEALRRQPLGHWGRISQSRFDHRAPCRLALLVQDVQDLGSLAAVCQEKLQSGAPAFTLPGKAYYRSEPMSGKVAFLFPGQGSQYPGMGAELAMAFDAARQVWDRWATALVDDPEDGSACLHEVVFPRPVFTSRTREQQALRLCQTRWAQPALGAASLSYLALLEKIGLRPDVAAGHSFGELSALYAAGGMASADDFFRAAAIRGQLMGSIGGNPGGMTAVWQSPERVQAFIHGQGLLLTVANHNSPNQTVVSGAICDLEQFEGLCTNNGIRCQRLNVADAFHSPRMASTVDGFLEGLQPLVFQSLVYPVYANATAAPYPTAPAQMRLLLAQQLVSPVRFADTIAALHAREGATVFVEVGPGSVLSRLVDDCLANTPHLSVSLDKGKPHTGWAAFWEALGKLSVYGVRLELANLWEGLYVPEYTAAASKNSVKINGANFGKVYPPPGGAQALPGPNPPARVAAPPASAANPPEPDDPRRLETLARLQENLLAAQESYQNTLKESHFAFLKMTESFLSSEANDADREQRLLAITAHAPPVFPEPVADKATSGASPAHRPIAQSTVQDRAVKAPSPPAPADIGATLDPRQALLDVVAEKTGYPADMLDLTLDLESGLGIDSIKRVEIMSALQEIMPALENVEPGRLVALTTLSQILEVIQELDAPPSTPADARTLAASQNKPLPLTRYVVQERSLRASGGFTPGLNTISPLWIVPDRRGIAHALAKRLAQAGIATEINAKIPASAQAVLHLQALDSLDPADSIGHAIRIQKEAFRLARRLANRLSDASGLFVLVFDSGGRADDPQRDPHRVWLSGLSGLARTAALEWPAAVVKSIELCAANADADHAAGIIFDELCGGGLDPEVILCGDQERRVPVVEAAAIVPGQAPLAPDTVVVASGGGRGVTAACLQALAQATPLKIALLGTTVLADEPQELRVFQTEAQLKAAVRDREARSGRDPTPLWLDARVKTLLAVREIKATVAELETIGATVAYFTADVTRSQAVCNALALIRERFGPIQAVIHAAGVVADKALRDKSDEAFARVFNTKVLGLKNLLEATESDPLSHLVCFSSVAAHFGNPGQADYSMANRVLSAVCRQLSQQRKGRCAVKAVGWGPWEGGMVDSALAHHFKTIGIGLIPLSVGAEAFVAELSSGDCETAQVVIGAGLDKWVSPGQTPTGSAFRKTRSRMAARMDQTPFSPLTAADSADEPL